MKTIVIGLVISLVFMLGTRADDTVVCVHGFLRSRANMWAMAGALHTRHRVLNWKYDSRAKTIEEHGADLVGELKVLAAQHPGRPIHFVTHSMGGLVVRSALNDPECPPEAKMGRAVLLAPPNRGAAAARSLAWCPPVRWIFGDQSGRQLMTTPEDGFDALGSFPSTMRVEVIAGDVGCNPFIPGQDDGKVGVEEARLPTPHAFVELHTCHSLIAWTPKVIRLTREFLEPPEEEAVVQ